MAVSNQVAARGLISVVLRSAVSVLLVATGMPALVAQDATLGPCLDARDDHFLALREVVVVDALERVPPALATMGQATLAEYLRAVADARQAVHLPPGLSEGWVVQGAQHWLVVTSSCTYVRCTAVSIVDERPGSLHLVPATPAVPGGAQALAQPDAIGVSLSAGSGRIFVGVRTQARSLAVTHADVLALARRVQAPSAAMVLAALDAHQEVHQ